MNYTTPRLIPAVAAAALFTAAVLAPASTAAAQSDTNTDTSDPNQQIPVPSNYPLPPEAATLFAGLMNQLQDVRGIKYTTADIPLRVMPVRDYEQRIRNKVDQLYPPDRRADIIAGLARFGMMEPGTDLAGQTATARLAQSAMVYNPRSDRVLLVMKHIPYAYLTDAAPFLLARVLQDQHYDIGAIDMRAESWQTNQPRNNDRALAIRFVLDGEPTFLQFKSNILAAGDAEPMTEQTEDETLKTLSSVQGVQITQMARPTLRQHATLVEKGMDDPILKAMFDAGDCGYYVINPIYAAQNRGAYFISFLNRVGGWEDVERAYRELPESTEQTLHPEKLFYEPDRPTSITLPNFKALTNAKWSLVDSAVHGQFHLFNLLRRWQFDRFDARLATNGWDGDFFQTWKSRAENHAIVVATTWDAEKDAEEFYKGYMRLLGIKYPNAEPDRESTTRRYSYACGNAALEHGWLILRGREVFIIEGLPKDLGINVLEELEAVNINYVD